MLLDFNSVHYNQKDCDIIKDNVDEIIQLGLKAYKKKYNKELTYCESVLLNIFIMDGYKYLNKDEITEKYNKLVYDEKTHKYIKPENITTKINRVNKKLKGMKIVNKYGYGYMLMIT